MNQSPKASEQAPIRTPKGQFAKGSSGNKGGRPKALRDVQELARAHTTCALGALVEVMQMGRPGERILAAKLILEWGWGKPGIAHEEQVGGELIPSLTINLRESKHEEFLRVPGNYPERGPR